LSLPHGAGRAADTIRLGRFRRAGLTPVKGEEERPVRADLAGSTRSPPAFANGELRSQERRDAADVEDMTGIVSLSDA
jgi:hypothetical protein